MIENFEKYTFELTEYEAKKVLPEVVEYLKTSVTKETAITNRTLIHRLQNNERLKVLPDHEKNIRSINPARIRKIIHEIRVKGILNRLISTSKGYWVTDDPEELKSYLRSLQSRLNSMIEVYNAVETDAHNFEILRNEKSTKNHLFFRPSATFRLF